MSCVSLQIPHLALNQKYSLVLMTVGSCNLLEHPVCKVSMLNLNNESICLQLSRNDSLLPEYGPLQGRKKTASIASELDHLSFSAGLFECMAQLHMRLSPRQRRNEVRAVSRRFSRISTGPPRCSYGSYCRVDERTRIARKPSSVSSAVSTYLAFDLEAWIWHDGDPSTTSWLQLHLKLFSLLI